MMLYLPYVLLLYIFLAAKINGSAFLRFFWKISLMHTFVGSTLETVIEIFAICILFMNVYWDCLLVEMWTITVYYLL